MAAQLLVATRVMYQDNNYKQIPVFLLIFLLGLVPQKQIHEKCWFYLPRTLPQSQHAPVLRDRGAAYDGGLDSLVGLTWLGLA